MPRKPTKGLLDDVAVQLYGKRIEEDTNNGVESVYKRNRDARQLYFKGVYDAMRVTRIWTNEASNDAWLLAMLTALEEQSKQLADAAEH